MPIVRWCKKFRCLCEKLLCLQSFEWNRGGSPWVIYQTWSILSPDPILVSHHIKKKISHSIFPFKYFSEQTLVALARNPLNMLVITREGIQKCSLIVTFVRNGLQ